MRLDTILVTVALSALAVSAGAGPNPAAPPETAQFGFLIGDWDCTTRFIQPNGTWSEGRARWTGRYILNGWAIQDTWISQLPGGGEFQGTNIRSFNPQTGEWDNRWVAQGSLQWKYFSAVQRGETMVMTGGEGTDARGPFVDRNVFYEIGPDAWRWRKDRSYDGGESWFEGVGYIEATRVHGPDPRKAVARSLDAFHAAAANADEQAYFDLLADDAVFLGTAPGERWDVETFRGYAHPHFERGSGWTYVPRPGRFIEIEADGGLAWFDEVLDSAKYGRCRGTGVLRLDGDRWRIVQYNLMLPVPNELTGELVERIRAAGASDGG